VPHRSLALKQQQLNGRKARQSTAGVLEFWSGGRGSGTED
jgi:hypothetical protein